MSNYVVKINDFWISKFKSGLSTVIENSKFYKSEDSAKRALRKYIKNNSHRKKEDGKVIEVYLCGNGNILRSYKNDPPVENKWYLCVTQYVYYFGKLKNGIWIDMKGNPIEDDEFKVVFYTEIPAPTIEMFENEGY